MTVLRSRDNARIRRWHRLVRDPRFRRVEGRAWLEGAHLVSEYLTRVGAPVAVIVDESRQGVPEIAALVAAGGGAPCVLATAVFGHVAETRSPTGIAAEIVVPVPFAAPVPATQETWNQRIFLDNVQDPGNLGSLLRSAAAFSAREAVLGPGCADPWAPRTLRAAMGAHFLLAVRECPDLALELESFEGTRVCTDPATGLALHALPLTGSIGWIFGGEGQGVSAALRALADRTVTIPMSGGSESINVAVAASICLYESQRQHLASRTAALRTRGA